MIKFRALEDRIVRVTDKVTDKVTDTLDKTSISILNLLVIDPAYTRSRLNQTG